MRRGSRFMCRLEAHVAFGICIFLSSIVLGAGAIQAQRFEKAIGNLAADYTSPQSLPKAMQGFSSQDKRMLKDLLRQDGTLDLGTGYRGPLDPEGYRLASNAGEPLRFQELSAPGDEWWADNFGLSGFSGPVNCFALDGSGNLYAGGEFTTAGGVAANRMAKWDGTSWEPLGGGLNDTVLALAVDGNGNLYAGGYFEGADGIAANYVAKWDGTSWSPLGSGMNHAVNALVVGGTGELYAGGHFTTAGGVAANYIAKWDGSSWSPLGTGMNHPVLVLALDASGNLCAGGDFTTAGGIAANYIAKWDGSSWSPLGTGMNHPVFVLAVDGSGNLCAGGDFTTAGGVTANHIAKWDGTSWSPLGTGMYDYVNALVVDGSGNLYAGGYFTVAGRVLTPCVARWDGSSWSPLGSGMNEAVLAVALDASGILYAGGSFSRADGVMTNCIAVWDGIAWSGSGMTDGSGLNGPIYALALDGSGNLYVGGVFDAAGGVAAKNIARWDGSSWSPLGSAISYAVFALAPDGSGNLYAGGWFTMAGGVTPNHIAKWDGTSWSPLGSGMDDFVYALVVDGSGNLYAGGAFNRAGGVDASHIARWDGSSWSPLGSGMYGDVKALVVDGSGNLYAGGDFTTAGGVAANLIAKWDGSSWSPLGSGMNHTVFALALDGSGNLYAGGDLTTAGGVAAKRIAKWDGSSWSPLGSGMTDEVDAFVVDGSGNLYAGGWFTAADGADAKYVAKWDGSSWSPLGTGMNNRVLALVVDGSGNLYAGGVFTMAGGKVSSAIAKWSPHFGSLQVSIDPPAAVTAGAQWMVSGDDVWRDSGETLPSLAVGQHTLQFMPIDGWRTPADQNITINDGQTTAANGVYVPQASPAGSLQVSIGPPAAVTAGAQWMVSGDDVWRNSGVTVPGLAVGQHTLQFKPISGWNTPADQTVTISDGHLTPASGTYVQQVPAVGSLQVTISPQGAIDAGAQWQVDGGNWQNSGATVPGLSVGQHTLQFKPITGWTTPANQAITISDGQVTPTSGTYVQLPPPVVKPTVTIRATDPKASEPGTDKGRFVITRTGDISRPLTVYYRVAGTAKTGIDYKKLTGKLVIPIGKTSANLYVVPINDRIKELKETVKVTLVNNSTYSVGRPATAAVTVADND